MKSDIKNIQIVWKLGAYGNPGSEGMWIYGKRPDGKTVPCKNSMEYRSPEKGVRIWSYWQPKSDKKTKSIICETEFSAEEWAKIRSASTTLQPVICNEILTKRKNQHAPEQ